MRLPIRLSVLSILVVSSVISPVAATADSTSEGHFVSDTNTARAHHSLRHYRVASDLTSTARRWARYMARHRTLAHNPHYSSQVCCWSSVGENVGVGPSEGAIERAFMSSAPHRDNILSRSFTQVGIGTARGSDGRLYVDELFRRPSSSAAVSTAALPVSASPAGSVPVRASRASARAALTTGRAAARPASAQQVLARRLAAARAGAPARPADAVDGAVSFVQVMRQLTGSAG